MTKRSINEHLARADALGDDLERITGKEQTGNVAELLAAQALCWCWPRWCKNPAPMATQWLHGPEKEKPHYVLRSTVSLSGLVGRAGLEPATKGL